MSTVQQKNSEEKLVLPHHEQQPLCTTRLPYRQGRKLTAVKVYTITNESPHLLVFGVPSLNLRQETKSLFAKFGRLMKFHVSTEHNAEPFTETYHVLYDNIQSSRLAKRMLDTKNFYGGSLHVCYAPELESIEETKQKLHKRRLDVSNRLKNLQREATMEKERIGETKDVEKIIEKEKEIKLVDMSVENIIFDKRNLCDSSKSKNISKRSSKREDTSDIKRFKPVFIENLLNEASTSTENECNKEKDFVKKYKTKANVLSNTPAQGPIEIIDFTSTERDTLSNIDEALNYNKFGNEIVKKIPEKPLNRIQFNIGSNNKVI